MTHKIRFRTQYDEDYRAELFATEIGEDENLVQQHMRDECDVNVIMKRYQQTGELTHIAAQAAQYGDYSQVGDYQQGLEQIALAEEMFMELPSSVRDRFKNDPGAFIDFAVDPKNIDEMRDMGLAPKSAAPAPEEKKIAKPSDPKPGEAPS